MFLAHGASVDMRDNMNWRPLHHAAFHRSHRVMAALLAHPGIDVNAMADAGWRPLDVCASVEGVRALLAAGAVHTATANAPMPSLHCAAFFGRPDVVQELLARGADVHEIVSQAAAKISFALEFGGAPLHFAAASLCGARSFRSSAGPEFTAQNFPNHVDAGMASARRVAVVEALAAAGADLNHMTPRQLQRATSLTSGELSPLHIAAHYGDAAVVAALLRVGAAINAAHPVSGWSALHMAVEQNQADVVYTLAAGGADVNRSMPGDRKTTPLDWAVLDNKHAVVRALLESGADSSAIVQLLPRTTRETLPHVLDATTRKLLSDHVSGVARPTPVCALPGCEARRRVDYDDKGLMACGACKARALRGCQALRGAGHAVYARQH